MVTTGSPSSIPAWRRHGLLLLLAVLYMDTFIGRQIMAVMIEPIKQEFNASDTAMGLVSGLAFAGVYALFGLGAGRLADRLPRTRVLAVCALIWSLTTVLCGFTTGFALLVMARMLVAIGESAVTPSSISLIADLYPANRRAFAISCYSTAPTLAAIIAMSAGAWLVEAYGWRTGFIVVGIPASLIALAILLVREPARGTWDHPPAEPRMPLSLVETLKSLWALKPYRFLIFAAGMSTLGANAYGMWNATFLVRSHGLDLQQAGVLAGFVGGGSAAIGMLFSGWFTDRLISAHPRWQLLIPQVGHGIGIFAMAAYLLWPADSQMMLFNQSLPTAMIWCALNGFFAVWWVGPCFSMITRLVSPDSRAVAMACQTVLVTLFGVGIGPLAVGGLSDMMTPFLATESLRYSLLLGCVSTFVAMLFLQRAYSAQQQDQASRGTTAGVNAIV
ncbi:spinster family MFS transporter [Marinobacterium sediminicola]|uniref:Sugar phosphate permease n=1 Tax=Marinobacterium sediminicola TaxID=518898 RepID=A0ABY1S4F4_9GAMM|nr:MFS transporter [Marinobacterium sediminicola]ULG70126.1 MFS transporter [Marinobacterium sediminicola]SMR78401.1 Sugar phosphate permease [Marinobacterium sediminicola]